MKMKVEVITRGYPPEFGYPRRYRDNQPIALGDRIVHLECGHEFIIPDDAPAPSYFDCRYCSQVQTIEEKERDESPPARSRGRMAGKVTTMRGRRDAQSVL
jgi:hypothetical protein